MPSTVLHRPLALALIGSIALLASGCQQEPAPAEQQEQATADPDAPEGISVSNARLVLPPVAGNPGAIYFDIANRGSTPLAIAGASVTGAGMAMLHTTATEGTTARMEHVMEVPVPVGEVVGFAPGGLHVMVHEIGDGLTPGSTTELTLTFADGDKVSVPANVQTVGDAS